MSSDLNPEQLESLLLDWHLNRLDDEQAKQFEQAIAASPELAKKAESLGKILDRLDQYPTPEPPSDLADRVMAGIEEQSAPILFDEARSAIPAGTAQDLSANPVLSFRELIAIAACITLIVGIFVPGYFKAQNIARRNMCRDNLRQIYTGIVNYAQDNNGYITYAGYVPGGSWLPWHQARTPGVKRASNTRPLFKLIQGKYTPEAKVFICPAVPHARPMLADNYKNFTDFAESSNITYSFQYMNLPKGRKLKDMNIRMVLLADRNPLFDGRSAGHNLNPYDWETTNSLTHEEGAGQNVVYADGRGGWFTQPTIGVNRDNIYRAGQLTRYQGTETPSSPTDTMLVP